MKNLILFVLGLVMCCSCTSEVPNEESIPVIPTTTEITQIEEENLTAVKLQLDSLNQVMFSDQMESRGWFKDHFKKFVTVVICDAVGGMFGAVWGGIGGAVAGVALASGAAMFIPEDNITLFSSNEEKSYNMAQMNPPEIALTSDLIPLQDSENPASFEDSIGYYHNMVLMALNDNGFSNRPDLDYLMDNMADIASSTYNITREETMNCFNENREFFETIVSDIVPNKTLDTSLHDAINRWISLYPQYQYKLNVLESFFNGLYKVNIPENDGDYLNKVLEIINKSTLDANMKRELRNAAIVGNASYQLWNVEEN